MSVNDLEKGGAERTKEIDEETGKEYMKMPCWKIPKQSET